MTETEQPTPPRTLIGLISSLHFVQHIFRILPPLLPVLVLAFPYPLWQLGALVSIYFAGSGLMQAPVGVLVDRYDQRYVLPPFVTFMGVGYLLFAAAPTLTGEVTVFVIAGSPFTAQYLLMMAGAFVAGLGASAIHPAGYPLVSANVPSDREGSAFGVWGSTAKLGDAAAPTAVALLVLVVTWDRIFLLFGVLGIAYGLSIFGLLSQDWVETRPAARRVEVSDEGDDDGRDGPLDRQQYAYPMLVLAVFFVARAFSEKGLKSFLPLFLVGVYGYSVTVGDVLLPPESFANVYFTGMFLVAAGVQLLTGRLVDRYDHRAVLLSFFGFAVVALVVLAIVSLSPVMLLVVLLVLGASNWGWTPARDVLVSEVAPVDSEGRTFGSLHTISHLFSAVAPIALGVVAEQSSLRESFLILALVMLVAVFAIAALYSRRVYRPVDQELATTRSD